MVLPQSRFLPASSFNKLRAVFPFLMTTFIAVICTAMTAFATDATLKENLVRRAESIATFIDATQVANLAGNEADLDTPEYTQLKERLGEFQRVNEDARFAYLMRKDGQNVIFLLDSEPAESEDYSPPGQIYEEVTEQFQRAFENGESGWEVAGDRWGKWMAGYAAIREPHTNKVIAVVGVDLDYYSNYLLPIIAYSLLPVFFFVIVLLILLYAHLTVQSQERILQEKEQILRISSHEIRTPMTEIRLACKTLVEDLHVAQNEEVLSLVQQAYVSSITMVRRIGNVLKAIELTMDRKFEVNKVDLVPLFRKAIHSHEKVASILSISLKVPELPTSILTKGNENDLQIIFPNLIAHSLYYAQKGESVEMTYEETSDKHIFSFMSVGDTLDEEEVQNLFSAYYKGEPMSGHTDSTGLGLYLVQKIVKEHQGTLKASSSEPGVLIRLVLKKA